MTPTIEYVDFLVDGLIGPHINLTLPTGFLDEPNYLCWTGKDEPYPMNLSRFLWLASGKRRRQFEADVLAYGKN